MQFISRAKKYAKYHKYYYKYNIIKKFIYVKTQHFNYIEYGVKYNLLLTSIQLKMLIQLIKNKIKPYKKILKIKLLIFPDFGKTQKPRDIRMGRGKGEVSTRIAFCRGGTKILLIQNILNVSNNFIETIFYECSKKIGIKTYFINYKII